MGSTMSLHFEKHKKTSMNSLQKHNERVEGQNHSNKNIDDSRTKDNIVLVKSEGKTYLNRFENKIEKHYRGKRAVRKDAVTLVSATINLGGDITEASHAEQLQVLKSMNLYLRERYEHVISSVIHVDETNPHLHFDFVPLTKDGRLSAKSIINKQNLQKIQDDSLKYVKEQFPKYRFSRQSDEDKLKNGLKKDVYEALKDKELAFRQYHTEVMPLIEEIVGREEDIEKKEKEQEQRDKELKEREDALEEQKSKYLDLNKREEDIEKKESKYLDLEKREKDVKEAETKLKNAQNEQKTTDIELVYRNAMLNGREREIDRKEAENKQIEEDLKETSQKILDKIDSALKNGVQQLEFNQMAKDIREEVFVGDKEEIDAEQLRASFNKALDELSNWNQGMSL